MQKFHKVFRKTVVSFQLDVLQGKVLARMITLDHSSFYVSTKKEKNKTHLPAGNGRCFFTKLQIVAFAILKNS
jgi:hypothetical protein